MDTCGARRSVPPRQLIECKTWQVDALEPTIGKVYVGPAAQIVVEFRGRVRTCRDEEDIANGGKEGGTTSSASCLLL
jgi:hypothetical protein